MVMKVLYNPTPKQLVFHEAADDWIVIGGSIGSGKSLAMLIESLGLQYNSHINGNHRCLIIRRTFPQLRELITRSKELFPQIVKGIEYNSSSATWTMPSGSTIQFGSCERDEDVEKYRGFEYNLICIDELSHFDTPDVWNFLSTRNRNSKGLPNRMIGTSNPCYWVKQLFNINDTGEDNQIRRILEVDNQKIYFSLRFIQMNTIDNPHLPPEYRARLEQLPTADRETLLYGKWLNPEIKGSIYGDLLANLELEKRIVKINYEPSADCYVSLDLGFGDHTSLIFFQIIQNEFRVIKAYENNRLAIDHYIDYIKKTNYRISKIILPHDSKNNSLQTGKSIYDYLVNAFTDSLIEVRKADSVEDGINQVKQTFPRLWIDRDQIRFIECLRNYKRILNKISNQYEKPLHDEFSDMMDAFRYACEFNPIKKPVIHNIPKYTNRFSSAILH